MAPHRTSVHLLPPPFLVLFLMYSPPFFVLPPFLSLPLRSIRALDPRLPPAEREASGSRLQQEMREQLADMTAGLGAGHMLVAAASRIVAQSGIFSK